MNHLPIPLVGNCSVLMVLAAVLSMLSSCPDHANENQNGTGLSSSQLSKIRKGEYSSGLTDLKPFDGVYSSSEWPSMITIKQGSYLTDNGSISIDHSDGRTSIGVLGMMPGSYEECREFFSGQISNQAHEEHDEGYSFSFSTKANLSPGGQPYMSVDPGNMLRSPNGNEYIYSITVWDEGQAINGVKTSQGFEGWCRFMMIFNTPEYVESH